MLVEEAVTNIDPSSPCPLLPDVYAALGIHLLDGVNFQGNVLS